MLEITKLNLPISKIDYIAHCADIHIRNWKRHDEYNLIFNALYEELQPYKGKNLLIYIGGDIAHAKTDMSPELIDVIGEFLTNLSSIAPTLIIPGNHDANLNNRSRLDVLTPILNDIDNPNIFYLKQGGLYEAADILIYHHSIYDDSVFIKADQINTDKKKIALYHGSVINSKLDSGMNISAGVPLSSFDGYDYGLLGDIHRRQFLNTSKTIAFPGSLIQQNFGEDYQDHGFLVWNLQDKTVKEINIYNPYGYYTVMIDKGVLPDNLPICEKTTLRICAKDTTIAQLKDVKRKINKKYHIKEPTTVYVADNTLFALHKSDYKFNEGRVREVDYQNQLISNYLKDIKVDKNLIKKVCNINITTNQALVQTDIVRNVVWKLKKFWFSNMFSFGEGNVIDFEHMTGTNGIFAPNHSGKSAILDAFCFCAYDESYRATKADQILNTRKDSFECGMNFELNSIDYFIEKRASKYKSGALKGKLRVDIDFYYLNEKGERVSLNGDQRKDTNRIIQSYIGTFDDFILTTLSLQDNNTIFIDKTQSERKELLSRFLDLQIFEQLYDIANKVSNDLQVLIRDREKNDYVKMIDDGEQKKIILYSILKQTKLEHSVLHTELNDYNNSILQKSGLIIRSDADNLDIKQIEKDIKSIEYKIRTKIDDINKEQKVIIDLMNEIDNEHKVLQGYDQNDVESKNLIYIEKFNDNQKLDLELVQLKQIIDSKIEKLRKLEEHKYDPNCPFCMNNVFVIDAIKTRETLKEDVNNVEVFMQKKRDIEGIIEETEIYAEQWNIINQLKRNISLNEGKLVDARKTHKAISDSLQSLNTHLNTLVGNKETYIKYQAIVEKNKVIEKEIEELRVKAQKVNDLISKKDQEIQDIIVNIRLIEHSVDQYKMDMQYLADLIEKNEIYSHYLHAIGRDGIPYQLISNVLPFLEAQINTTLGQITDFHININTDGKSINVWIDYGDGNTWPLELSSGMERFISSLAIRIALIMISNLPRPNFIAIDEGLGVLDPSNLNSMHIFFNYLKDSFTFALIISHIDVVRDMVDNIITIDNKNGFSYINV